MRRALGNRFPSFHPAGSIILLLPLVLLILPTRYSSANSYYYKKKENGVVYYTNVDPKSSGYKKVPSPWGTFRGTPRSKRGYLNSYKYSDEFDQHINSTARWYGVDPLLIKAMIKVESNFNPDAVSPRGAMGIMQLMPGTAERLGVSEPFDPVENIEGGVKYFNKLMNMFDDVTLAIAGYNAGENAVIKYGNKIPPYSETIEYVEKVYKHYDHLRNNRADRNIDAMVAERKDKPRTNTERKNEKSFVYIETVDEAKVISDSGGGVRTPKKQILTAKARATSVDRVSRSSVTVQTSNTNAFVTSDSDSRYAVQLASFPDVGAAREMERTLKSKSYPAYVEKADLGGKGTWYRVKVGRFSTKSEASNLGNEIKTAEPDVSSILVTMN